MTLRYGYEWPEEQTDLTIELSAFLMGITPEMGGLGKAGHAKNCIDMLWNFEGSTMKFDWHPWAERMLEYSCEHNFLAVAGCASSGKTDFYAVWSILCYIADPKNTKVLVTSTSLKDAKLRIWGRICEYWGAVPGLPGKLVDSLGVIKYVDPDTGVASETSGITLIAGDPKKEKEAIGKLIGFKRRRVILVADELPELSLGILMAALSNLTSNPYFQLIGIGNPNSYYDAFGVFSKPKAGWKSINLESEEWETDFGVCIRFDGEKSPNVLAGREIYTYMLTREKIDKTKTRLGDNSQVYWRMMRGFWSPSGSESSIYSEADIEQNDASSHEIFWSETPTAVGFLDTAFTFGGDCAYATFGKLGLDREHKLVLVYDEEPVLISENITVTNEPVNFQIATQYRDACVERGISPKHAGVDSTGGGGPFCDILSKVWSPEFYRCYFGGKASEMLVSSSDERLGHEAYVNRVSEIWFAGVELIRSQQLRGMSEEFIKQAVARQYKTVKGATGVRMEVEPKKKMIARIGMSPDAADSGFGLLDLCRERLGLASIEKAVVNSNRTHDVEKKMDEMSLGMKSLRGDHAAPSSSDPLRGYQPQASGFISLHRD